MRGSTDVAIVGGGVLGSAIALHLAEAGLDVTLLERDGIGQATSAAGAGFIGMWAAGWTPTFGREHIEIERYGLDFYRDLAEHEEFGYRANGNLYVATTEATWDEQIAPKLLDLDAVPSLQRLSPDEVADLTGIIPADAVYGGILHPDGAQVSAGPAARALSRRFVAAGGQLETRTPAAGLRRQGDQVTGVETPRGALHAGRVIVAAGAWTNALLATIDVKLPVVPLVAFRVVTEPLGVPATMPTIMIGEVPMYLREYDGALLWGMHYRAAPRFRFVEEAVPERFDQLPLDGLAEAESKAATAFDVFPLLAASQSRTVAFGAPTFTPDQRPCLGPVDAVEGLYVATGCNEAGVTHAPGYGRLLAELLTSGTTELCSIHAFDPDRFGDEYPDGTSVVSGLQRTRQAI
jgi:sarcosine oxidase subunit beta